MRARVPGNFTAAATLVVNDARDEASAHGSPYVETEHLLLALLYKHKRSLEIFAAPDDVIELIREQTEARIMCRERLSPETNIPFSMELRRIVNHARDKEKEFGYRLVTPEHLLLSIFQEEGCFAASILREYGVRAKGIPTNDFLFQLNLIRELSRDLTRAAMYNEARYVDGRDEEINSVIEVFCSLSRKSPILLGEPSVGKSTVIAGLAERIATGKVPQSLVNKRLLVLAPETAAGYAADAQSVRNQLAEFIAQTISLPEVILCVEDLPGLLLATPSGDDFSLAFETAITANDIQCIATGTIQGFKEALQTHPWLGLQFRSVPIKPLSEDSLVKILMTLKSDYEHFHCVNYLRDAIKRVAQCLSLYFPDSPPVQKAIELIDSTGSRAKLLDHTLPEEIEEVIYRIRFIVHRMEMAIQAHEYEKARFYSDEERKERKNLDLLREKYSFEVLKGNLSKREIDETVSRLTGIPVKSVSEDRDCPLPDPNKTTTEGSGSQWAGLLTRAAARNGAAASSTASDPLTKPALGITEKQDFLRVFLCHSSQDKPKVIELYKELRKQQISPWLDKEDLLGGQDWRMEIANAIRASHVVIVCLSVNSVSVAGFRHKEIREVLEVAYEQPDGTIFLIPLRLEHCEIPSRLRDLHYVDYFEPDGFGKLMTSLRKRATEIGL